MHTGLHRARHKVAQRHRLAIDHLQSATQNRLAKLVTNAIVANRHDRTEVIPVTTVHQSRRRSKEREQIGQHCRYAKIAGVPNNPF